MRVGRRGRAQAWPTSPPSPSCSTVPPGDAQVLNEQLTQALNTRIVIEQAKGVVAERHQLSMDAAFETLRQHARNSNLKLTDVALAVARGDLDPAAVAGPSAGS